MALNLSRETKVYVSTGNGVHASGSGVKTASLTSSPEGTSGYEVGDLLVQNSASDSSGSGTGVRAFVSAVNGSGQVTGIHIPNNGRGSGHAAADVITFPTAQVVKGSGNSATVSGTVQIDIDSVGGTTTTDGSRTAAGLFKGNSTSANTFRIGVLDGYSFSQANSTTDVAISEAGATPQRGSKRFNDSLDAGEWSFQTYLRPYKHHSSNSWGSSGTHDAVEQFLWNAVAGNGLVSNSAVARDSTDMTIDFEESDVHELMKFQLYFVLENTTYRLNDCQVNTAEIDFSIDGIGTITWSGNCTTIDQVTDVIEDPNVAFSDVSGDSARAHSANAVEEDVEGMNFVDVTGTDDADYIKNKLSTLTLSTALQGGGSSSGGLDARTYSASITGGTITISNNITYLTPETLGVVDQSIGSFTGSRQVSGSLNMYLDTKSNGSNQLLKDLSGATSLVNNVFDMSLFMGGASAPNAEFDITRAHLAIPTIDVADLISVTVEFAAQGTTITDQDELIVNIKGSKTHNDSTYGTDRSA